MVCVVTAMQLTQSEITFWERAYVASISLGRGVYNAAQDADNAIGYRRERIKHLHEGLGTDPNNRL